MAKLILLNTDAGKEFPLSAGLSFEEVFGTSSVDKFSAAKGVTAKISAGAGVDLITLGGSKADYTVKADGTDAVFTLKADNTTVTLKTNAEGDTIKFADGSSLSLKIADGAVKLGEQALTATAADIAGGSNNGGGTVVSLDGKGTDAAAMTVDASTGSFAYTDSATVANNVKLTGFAADDKITFSGVTQTQLDSNIQSNAAGDVTINVNSNGVLSSVSLVGVNPTGGLVFDVASFNALPVGDLLFA